MDREWWGQALGKSRGENPGERPSLQKGLPIPETLLLMPGQGGGQGVLPLDPRESCRDLLPVRNRAGDHFGGTLLHPLTVGDSSASSGKYLLFTGPA